MLEILDAERREVRFRSDLGDAWGVWQADVVPSEGPFDVEIDIPEEITTWLPSDGDADMLNGDPSRRQAVTVHGTVQTVDEDSMTSLRVGRDIMLIEMSNETVPPQPGSTIRFDTPEIHLYPYQL
ncbi:hypothetical protein AB0B50_03835 [Streptomyces sp. NPDC041068]|uniref:hypothetical protein n=1 Tax=Streptomyces sp. NPDC041068 TaxID=3155130 RepID=UPI0033E3C8B3